MIAIDTIKKYINKCEEVLQSKDNAEAKKLEKIIVSTCENDMPGLKKYLSLYRPRPIVVTSSGNSSHNFEPDCLGDIELLLERLKLELEKEEKEDKKNEIAHEETPSYSQNFYTNQGNFQIQNNTVNSSQSQQNLETLDFEKANKIINEIINTKDQFKQELGEHGKDLDPLLIEAKDAIAVKDRVKLNKVCNRLKNLAMGVTEGLIAAEVVELLNRLPGLIN